MRSKILAECHVNCSICHSEQQRPVRRLNGYQIVRCARCGFAFVNPRPSEERILKAYSPDDGSAAISFSAAYQTGRPVENHGSWTSDWVLQKLIDRSKLSFLDIGAGQGWAVKKALEMGADAYGYEIGDERAFDRDEKIKQRIFRAEKEIEKSGFLFDRIHLSAVLEHVYDPVVFLKSWARFLKPGGIFCVAGVPNLESFFVRLGLDGWDGNIPPHHLNYFGPETLVSCIQAAGGQVTRHFSMGLPQSANIVNIFRQKQYDAPIWGDRSEKWLFTKQPASCSGSPAWAVAIGNTILKWTGGGANLYAFFVLNSGVRSD